MPQRKRKTKKIRGKKPRPHELRIILTKSVNDALRQRAKDMGMTRAKAAAVILGQELRQLRLPFDS